MANESEKNNKLVKASARDLRIAPRKLRLVSNMLRGMRAVDAVTQLEFLNKKGAPMVKKLLLSAIANAENNFSLKGEALFIKSITTDMGKVMKRYFPRARGSAFVIRRKLAHLNVVLEEKPGSAKKSRFALFKKTKQESTAESVKTTPETEFDEVKSETVKNISAPKSMEVVKASKVQQKRRLFNRKSGE